MTLHAERLERFHQVTQVDQTGQVGPKSDASPEEDRAEIFTDGTNELRGYLEGDGEPNNKLGGIKTLGAELPGWGQFEYADGQDITQFLGAGSKAEEKQDGLRIVLQNEDLQVITPSLCVRVRKYGKGAEGNVQYYAVSGENIFEIPPLTQQEASATSTPHLVYPSGEALTHRPDGTWGRETQMPRNPLIEVQRMSPDREIRFMLDLVRVTYEAVSAAKVHNQRRPSASTSRPDPKNMLA